MPSKYQLVYVRKRSLSLSSPVDPQQVALPLGLNRDGEELQRRAVEEEHRLSESSAAEKDNLNHEVPR